MEQEQFKPVPGWEGLYSIGSHGTVKSHLKSGKILSHKKTKAGYHYVALSTGLESPTTKNLGVARLMAAAFIPNPDDLAEIVMINGDKEDLRLDNIEWTEHNSDQRKVTSYLYEVWHKDAPHVVFVFNAMRQIIEKTGMGPLSVQTYMLRHPGKPGRSGWAIKSYRKEGFGYRRLDKND
jgi:hypothetical protein